MSTDNTMTMPPTEELTALCTMLEQGGRDDGDYFYYQTFHGDTAMDDARKFAETMRSRIPEELATIRQSGVRVIVTPTAPPAFI